MPLRDLLGLADLALSGQTNPQLPEDLVRSVLEESSSRVGILRANGQVVARWPRSAPQSVETVTDGWTEVSLGSDGKSWALRLLQPERLDEFVLGAARLVLRAWDLREELKRTRFDERFHLWELEAIRSIATSIGGIFERERLAEELISHLVALLGVRSAHLYLGRDAGEAKCVGSFGARVLEAADLELAWQQALYRDDVVALPLQSDTGTFGVLVAAEKEARAGTEPFATNDVRLLELFAVQVTVALEYVRLTQESLERERLRRELEMAAVIQSHLHPQSYPAFAGFRLAGQSSPSRHVAGDTYDVLVHDGLLLAAVTDVSGKGVGAGMLASGIHAGTRLLSEECLSLEDMSSRLNRYLVGATADNRFATMAMVRLAPNGDLMAINAGHCPILIRRANGEVVEIESSGLPLGILPGATYSEEHSHLEPGDFVVLYTDGLTEAENPAEEEFGVERVADALGSFSGLTAGEVCHQLMRVVNQFADGKPLSDDATLLVVERLNDG